MGRAPRVDIADIAYRVINRSNGKVRLFNAERDYRNIESVLEEARSKFAIKMYAYCIMPNHWHLVVSPQIDGGLSRFMQWLTLTHAQRYHASHKTAGFGHIYQGRYKSFPVQTNEYFLQYGNDKQKKLLSRWHARMPHDYISYVNSQEKEENLEELRSSVNRGKPYGGKQWISRFVSRFDLGFTIRPRGRPKNKDKIGEIGV